MMSFGLLESLLESYRSMAVSGKYRLQNFLWMRSLNPVLSFGLSCMLAGCVIQRGTSQVKAPEPITPGHSGTVSPSPAPLPLPPLEALYARYPSHLLGIGEGCHVDASIRQVAAEQAARYHLARTVHVTITSELTWLKTSRLSTSEGKESFREVFCKTYREAVDEWLGATHFERLLEYTNHQGTPCIQLLTVISLAEWHATVGLIPRSEPLSPEALEPLIRARMPLERARAIAEGLHVSDSEVLRVPEQLCIEEVP